MPTEERATFAEDDRGAVMVMGIFMCSCLVAAMWYLAGLGDTVLYRERMQEAADAIAFSDAALHARAMNLLVLINLIMSVVLAIRVALRVGKLACTIGAAVFAALAFVNWPLAAAAASCAAAAEVLDQADTAVKPEVELVLRGLMSAQEGIRTAAPPAAWLAVTDITAGEYAPVVTKGAAYRPMDSQGGTDELPVERGDPGKLCREAAHSMGDLFKWSAQKLVPFLPSIAIDALNAMLEGLVGTSTDYFCDLSAGSSPDGANSEAQMNQQVVQECAHPDGIADGLYSNFYGKAPFDLKAGGSPGSERQWEQACAICHVTCNGFDPIKKLPDGSPMPLDNGDQRGSCTSTDPKVNQAILDADRLQRDEDLRSIKTFEKDGQGLNCVTWADKDLHDRKSEQEQQQKQEPPPPNSKPGDSGTSQGQSAGENIAPLRVQGFSNNSKEGVFIGAVLGESALLGKDAKIVRIGAFHSKRTPQNDDSHAKLPAWAQAEMFFDCDAGWTDSKKCNDDEDAMWHFQWRARLRRFDQPMNDLMPRLQHELLGFTPPLKSPDQFADDLANEAPATAGGGSTNAALRRELSQTIKAHSIRDQGVH